MWRMSGEVLEYEFNVYICVDEDGSAQIEEYALGERYALIQFNFLCRRNEPLWSQRQQERKNHQRGILICHESMRKHSFVPPVLCPHGLNITIDRNS